MRLTLVDETDTTGDRSHPAFTNGYRFTWKSICFFIWFRRPCDTAQQYSNMQQYMNGNEVYTRSDWIEFSQCCENYYYLPKLLIINLAADNIRGIICTLRTFHIILAIINIITSNHIIENTTHRTIQFTLFCVPYLNVLIASSSATTTIITTPQWQHSKWIVFVSNPIHIPILRIQILMFCIWFIQRAHTEVWSYREREREKEWEIL